MYTIKDQIEHSEQLAEKSGLPAQIKEGGVIFFLCWGGNYFYKTRNAPKSWGGSQFLLKGKKSFTPYWAMTQEGLEVVKKAAAQINRNRLIKSWA